LKLLITGSSGLIGSEAVAYFSKQGFAVVGVDNNMRADFFGEAGDTLWNRDRLVSETSSFTHVDLDIRDRSKVLDLFGEHNFEAIIHCAAQPSHDLAASRPFDDFEVNALGTLNLLEASRQRCPESPFIFLSTNKVYGDAPNEIDMIETETRFEYRDPDFANGINELFRIDQSKHSLFGASKAAADIMVQEYGRYFNMPTACFRGGCLTGPNHSGVELHGFLNYLVKVYCRNDPYTIFGYKGKQVRDQIHSYDVVTSFHEFIKAPRVGQVYNLGGGRESNASILECFEMLRQLGGRQIDYSYSEKNREGDHICYISDMSKFKEHYPSWKMTRFVTDIVEELYRSEVGS